MLSIQKQAGKHLMRLMAQLCLEKIAHRLRAFQRRVAFDGGFQMTTAHFKHRLQLSKLGRPQPCMPCKFFLVGLKQLTQATKLIQKTTRQLDSTAATDSGA